MCLIKTLLLEIGPLGSHRRALYGIPCFVATMHLPVENTKRKSSHQSFISTTMLHFPFS